MGAFAIHVFSNHAQFAPIGFDGVVTMLSETTKLSQVPDIFAYYTEVNGLQDNFRWRREDPAN